MIRVLLLAGVASLAMMGNAEAQQQRGRVTVTPYIEVGQVLVADLTNDVDTASVVDRSRAAANACESARNNRARAAPTQPQPIPCSVSLPSALSARRVNRYSAREVNIR